LARREPLLEERFGYLGLVELLGFAGLVLGQELQLRQDFRDLLLARRLHARMGRLGLAAGRTFAFTGSFLRATGRALTLIFLCLAMLVSLATCRKKGADYTLVRPPVICRSFTASICVASKFRA
jgi:hypothetical protein